jgi:hypothetical protein
MSEDESDPFDWEGTSRQTLQTAADDRSEAQRPVQAPEAGDSRRKAGEVPRG